jgi:hypothetical protein
MRVRTGLFGGGIAALAALGFALAVVLASAASAHSNPCHSQHTCPSDHHTYVWTDPTTGLQWDCAEPGAPEYDPILDVTTIVWDGRTYYCRAAGTTTTTMTTSTTTVTTSTTLPTTARTDCHSDDFHDHDHRSNADGCLADQEHHSRRAQPEGAPRNDP